MMGVHILDKRIVPYLWEIGRIRNDVYYREHLLDNRTGRTTPLVSFLSWGSRSGSQTVV
jgi:hypothetical protein